MTEQEANGIISEYIAAYNRFDVDQLVELLHPEIDFRNYAGEEITARAEGKEEFRTLADQSRELFSSRRQTVQGVKWENGVALVDVDFAGELAVDLPNGMNAGDLITLKGKTEFVFSDGKILKLYDHI